MRGEVMKKRVFMMCCSMVLVMAGCGKMEDGFREETQSAKELDNLEIGENIGGNGTKQELSTTNNDDIISSSAISYAEDEEVKLRQESYMQGLHSQKGKSVVTRSEGDGVKYTEKLKTEEEGHIDVYYYSFSNTQKQYETVVQNYVEDEDCEILEQDDQAFYLKVKRISGQDTYFENVEDRASKDNQFEMYIE